MNNSLPPLPTGFETMLREILGEEAEDLIKALDTEPVTSIRFNTGKFKPSTEGLHKVPWCESGVYLQERPVFTLDPLMHAGAYYVQDASSMIYETLLRKISSEAFGNRPLRILDFCAAPGGKTTAMINALPEGSHITANEFIAKRASILKENLAKWGYPNYSVTGQDASFYAKQGEIYDIVAVDAPCSGEGMMRKEAEARKQWSPELIDRCSRLQKEILEKITGAVKPGGLLIYSTCTFNRIENEENAAFITSELGFMPYNPDFPAEWGIPRGIDTELPVYRFMPHKTRGEGLFLSVFRKPGEWESGFAAGFKRLTQEKNRNKKPENKKSPTEEMPPIEEILSMAYAKDSFPNYELTEREALAYLRKEVLHLPPEVPKGLVTVTYRGLPLGQVKNIGARANNLYPKNWRIRI